MSVPNAVTRMRLAAIVLEHVHALLAESLPASAPEAAVDAEVRRVMELALGNYDALVRPPVLKRSDPILEALVAALPAFLDALQRPGVTMAPAGPPPPPRGEPVPEEEERDPVVPPAPGNGSPEPDV